MLRLCMDDAPVPYASSMEKAVVKRGSDLVARSARGCPCSRSWVRKTADVLFSLGSTILALPAGSLSIVQIRAALATDIARSARFVALHCALCFVRNSFPPGTKVPYTINIRRFLTLHRMYDTLFDTTISLLAAGTGITPMFPVPPRLLGDHAPFRSCMRSHATVLAIFQAFLAF